MPDRASGDLQSAGHVYTNRRRRRREAAACGHATAADLATPALRHTAHRCRSPPWIQAFRACPQCHLQQLEICRARHADDHLPAIEPRPAHPADGDCTQIDLPLGDHPPLGAWVRAAILHGRYRSMSRFMPHPEATFGQPQ